MTKGEIRKARKEARATGIPLTGELTLHNKPSFASDDLKASGTAKMYNLRPTARHTGRGVKSASRAEQYARYIDCGPSNWDDR